MCLERWRKQFSPVRWLYRSCIASLCTGKDREISFHLSSGPVKFVYASLCAWKDRGSNFHLSAGSVKLV